MGKKIDPLKKKRLKQGLITGKSAKQATLEAGYSPSTANNATSLSSVKLCQDEILQEWKLSDVTVEQVVKEIDEVRVLALNKGDLNTAGRMSELKGRYLMMFTDKIKVDNKIITDQDQSIIDTYMPKLSDTNRLCN